MPLAHFTPAELPGTLAVLVFGIVIGASLALRRRDSTTLGIVGFCGLAAIGSVLDHFQGVGTTAKVTFDVVFLAAAIALLALLIRRSPERAGRARSR